MKITCYFEDCGNTWEYKGTQKHYLTCSGCGRRISIKKAVRLMGESKEETQ